MAATTARAFQGAAGALLAPSALSLLTTTLPNRASAASRSGSPTCVELIVTAARAHAS